MPVPYDPAVGYLLTSFRITSTVVPQVLRRPEFWALLVLHLSVHWAYNQGHLTDHHSLDVDTNHMRIVQSVTTFFEVFYTNQCFDRYQDLYSTSRKMLSNLYDFAFEMRLHLSEDLRKHARLCCRYLAASVLLFFYETTDAEVTEEEWEDFLYENLLKPEEEQFLQAFERHERSLVLLHWGAEVCLDACNKGKLPAIVQKALVTRLLQSRSLEQAVVDKMALPMPFQHFHLLNVMVVVNLALWAYDFARTRSIFGPLTFVFATLIFMGMLELAVALSDPFGDDDVDFAIPRWTGEFLEHVTELAEFESPIDVRAAMLKETPLFSRLPDLHHMLHKNLLSHQRHHHHRHHHKHKKHRRHRDPARDPLGNQDSDSDEEGEDEDEDSD